MRLVGKVAHRQSCKDRFVLQGQVGPEAFFAINIQKCLDTVVSRFFPKTPPHDSVQFTPCFDFPSPKSGCYVDAVQQKDVDFEG